MRIAIILGSIREKRQSEKVARYLKSVLDEEDGLMVDLLDLKEYNLPVMEERLRFLENPTENIKVLGEKLDQADGILIVSPEYNGSYSGVLKNALDYYKSEYARKAIGVVTVSAGSLGGIQASMHLQNWVLHVGGFALPGKLTVSDVERLFVPGNEEVQKKFEERAKKFLDDYLWFFEAIINQKSKNE